MYQTLSVLVLLGAVTALPRDALARKKTVCLYQVRGTQASAVRQRLRDALSNRYRVVRPQALRAAASRLGLRGRLLRPRTLRRVARAAAVDAVVTVRIRRWRRRWRLSVQVRDGATGRRIKRFWITLRARRARDLPRGKLTRTLSAALDRAKGVPQAQPGRGIGTRLGPRPKRIPPPTPQRARRAPPAAGPELKTLLKLPAHRFGLRFSAGIGVGGRWFTFADNGPTYDTPTPMAPLQYELEVYPGAFFSKHPFAANLGLFFRHHAVFNIVTRPEGSTTDVATSIHRVSGGLSFRWRLARSKLRPILIFMLGVDMLQFTFDQQLGQMPGVRYVSVYPAVQLWLPLAGDRLSVGGRLGGLITLAAGQINDREHYGKGSAGGLEAALEISVRLWSTLQLVAGASTTWLFLRFARDGAQGVDYLFDSPSAVDGYYTGYLRVVFSL